MKFKMKHSCITVKDLDKSLQFYADSLDLKEERRITAPDGSYIIVFLGDGFGHCQLELTWYRDKEGAYNLGDNEIHVGFRTDDYEGALAKHKEMGCVVFENQDMGIYFIGDPDGYWMEVIPTRKPEDW